MSIFPEITDSRINKSIKVPLKIHENRRLEPRKRGKFCYFSLVIEIHLFVDSDRKICVIIWISPWLAGSTRRWCMTPLIVLWGRRADTDAVEKEEWWKQATKAPVRAVLLLLFSNKSIFLYIFLGSTQQIFFGWLARQIINRRTPYIWAKNEEIYTPYII